MMDEELRKFIDGFSYKTNKYPSISVLIGKTLKEINVIRQDRCKGDEIFFIVSDDEIYNMKHYQDCCETVDIEDICGELDWLVGSPILKAEERTNQESPKGDFNPEHDSFTWTFYEICTLKGSVTIRWYGTSNGYYSEGVSFVRSSQ